MAHGKFGTVINCMDGRVQDPVAHWLREAYHLDYVDTITEPGADRVLAEGTPEQLAALLVKARISAQAHGSQVIAVVGHDDCAGNPVPPAEHHIQIRRAAQEVRGWGIFSEVLGLWVDRAWRVEVVVRK